MSPIVKRKGEKFTLPGKYLLFILTIICAGAIILTFNTNIFGSVLNTAVGYVIIPFEKGISSVGGWLSRRSEELVQIRSLLSENESLKAQIDELTIDNTILQQERYELTTLRDLYQLDSQYEGYEKVGARIIAKDAGNWFHSFVIDKGEEDGISIYIKVIAVSCLVRSELDLGPNWAKVTSIIADNSNVSGKVLATSDHLVVSGDLELYGSGVIKFEKLVDSADKVVEGDKIVTSNISDKYLPNILIGYINVLNVDANNITKSGQLTPAVDFEHLEEVLVITQLKQSIEE